LKNRDISETVWLILAKFRTTTHVSLPDLNGYSTIHFLNPTRQIVAIFKTVKRNISATISPILMIYGKMMHIDPLYPTGY